MRKLGGKSSVIFYEIVTGIFAFRGFATHRMYLLLCKTGITLSIVFSTSQYSDSIPLCGCKRSHLHDYIWCFPVGSNLAAWWLSASGRVTSLSLLSSSVKRGGKCVCVWHRWSSLSACSDSSPFILRLGSSHLLLVPSTHPVPPARLALGLSVVVVKCLYSGFALTFNFVSMHICS